MTPEAKLNVAGVTSYTTGVKINASGSGSVGLETSGDWGLTSSGGYRAASFTGAVDVTGNTNVTGNTYVSESLGIGNTSPATKLHIDGTGQYPPDSGTTSGGITRVRADTNIVLETGMFPADPWSVWQQVSDSSDLSLTYPLLLQPRGGYVGVGTMTPEAKFNVEGGTLKAHNGQAFGIAIQGIADGGANCTGVYGSVNTGTGVKGSGDTGVDASGTNTGLKASGSNFGIEAQSNSGIGVKSVGSTYDFVGDSGNPSYISGSFGIGTAPNVNAALDVYSTTKAFLPPRMTTDGKFAIPDPTEGMVVYDTTLHKLCVFTTTTWETVSSSAP
jgi:hypothetical protein